MILVSIEAVPAAYIIFPPKKTEGNL